ncbi:hypothetical protein Tco_1402028 [Tanacetum coccineum]
MVAYLLKSEGSEWFHQIIDFLNASYIKYALTENPTIYASFIKQFWRTPTASTDANGQVELIASIDGQEKTITEASLRTHLKLVDSDGLTYLLNSEIFEQLALIGYKTDSDKLTFQKEEAIPMPHESPLYSVHSLGRDEGSLSLNELTLILRVKKLEHKVKTSKSRRKSRLILSDDGEDSSKQERKIFEIDTDPIISLVQPEQEDVDIHIRTSDDTEVLLEEDQPTEREEYQGSGEKGEKEVTTLANFQTYTRRSREVSIGSDSTAGKKKKDKGKAIKTEPEPEKKTKLQIRQERASLEAAIRQLQEGINIAGQERVVVEDDQAHVIEWSDPSVISANKQKLEDDAKKEELQVYLNIVSEDEGLDVKSLSTKYPIVDWKTHVLTETCMYYQIIWADGSSKNYKIISEMLYDFDRQNVLELDRLVKERFQTASPEGYNLLISGDLSHPFTEELNCVKTEKHHRTRFGIGYRLI